MAAWWTIALSALVFLGGGIVGFLIMLLRTFPNKFLRYLSGLYVEFFQGTPLLMQLFLTFFGLSVLLSINLRVKPLSSWQMEC